MQRSSCINRIKIFHSSPHLPSHLVTFLFPVPDKGDITLYFKCAPLTWQEKNPTILSKKSRNGKVLISDSPGKDALWETEIMSIM